MASPKPRVPPVMTATGRAGPGTESCDEFVMSAILEVEVNLKSNGK
jgi:hypothetical protein